MFNIGLCRRWFRYINDTYTVSHLPACNESELKVALELVPTGSDPISHTPWCSQRRARYTLSSCSELAVAVSSGHINSDKERLELLHMKKPKGLTSTYDPSKDS